MKNVILNVNKMADLSVQDSIGDISKLKVPDLKKELKSRGLSTSGNKSELMERLQDVLKLNNSVGVDSVDDLDEELLNDEDEEHLETNDSVISDIDSALDESSTQKSLKRKSSESTSPTDLENKPIASKKVILNRNTPINFIQKSSSSDSIEPDTSKEEKKVIKLSQLSAKERLEMRAKKFGVTTLSDEAKKVARIERFTGSNNSTSGIKTTVNASMDMLKQRAERFGCNVSSVMTKLENQEKLEKRKARFGATTNTNGVTSEGDKAKLRLERFKQPVK